MKLLVVGFLYVLFFSGLVMAEEWSVHVQATTIDQYHDDFPSSYSGTNSLSPSGEDKLSLTSTLFVEGPLWKDAELHFTPEVATGSGLSATHGVAGFPNGEIYRVSAGDQQFSMSRLYLKQNLQERITFVAGKFSLNDFFDNNIYSHDPRTQFMNWSLMDNGAWDYAADTRGYTWGFMLEYHEPQWAIRYSSALEPLQANGPDMDMNIAQAHGDNLELEVHYKIKDHPGALRLLGFVNHAYMGVYQQGETDITQTRNYRTKYGGGINLEQELSSNLGTFFRAGWNDGKTESFAFTEVDGTVSGGISLKGSSWSRPDDVYGLAFIINEISSAHADYLAGGGYGFLIGDGNLNYGPEQIIETYYSYKLLKFFEASLDYQFVNNPAYNRDRGPVNIYSGRLHFEL